MPDDHPLTAPLEDLGDLAVAAVEGWDEAIAANRDLVAHVERVRSPERVGERTYDDLCRRVENKKRRYALEGGTAAAPNGDGGADASDVVSTVVTALEGRETDRIGLDTMLERAATVAANNPAIDDDSIADIDVIYAL